MRAYLLHAVAVSLLLLTACTVDEDTVDNKACVPGSTNPAEQCITGFKCVPYPEGATCEKERTSGLRVQDHRQQTTGPSDQLEVPPDLAHNRRLLRRLGLDL